MNKSQLKIILVSKAKVFLGKDLISNFIQRSYISNYQKKKIIFIHIPKAAGTSIANVIYGKRNGHLKASIVKRKLRKSYNESYSFSVCRNPYERLLSAYAFARQGTTKDGAIAQSSKYQQKPFESFETFVKEWLVFQDLTQLDPVFQPQHSFVFENDVLLVNDIYKVENLVPLERKLSKLLAKEVMFGRMNQSNRKSEAECYSPEIREIVYRLYEKDFRLFNYDRLENEG